MEITTTDKLNDTIVFSRETFEALYHEAPEKSSGQLYYDGILVTIVDIEYDNVYLQSSDGIDLIELYS
jgi:hypothetical protein